jgi:hypothetical protein
MMMSHSKMTQKNYVKKLYFHNTFLSVRADMLRLTAEQVSASKCSLDTKCPAYFHCFFSKFEEILE